MIFTGVDRTGRISQSWTETPRRAHCQAASEPARPAAMSFTGVDRTGRISQSWTETPRRAHCQAASEPARPAPMIFTGAVINYDDAGGTPARQPARCRRYKVLYGRNLEVRTMARISLIEPNQASSEVKEIYEKLLKGKPGNVTK